MPKIMEKFLKSLTPSHADEVWTWLDGDRDAIEQMISVVADIAQNGGL
jgi:hypothetical protein